MNRRAEELRRRYVPSGPHPDYEAIPVADNSDATSVIPAKPVLAEEKPLTCDGWPFDNATAVAKQKAASPNGEITCMLNLGDGVKLELVRVPGGKFIMGASDGRHDASRRSVVEVKPFWMAKFETSNQQFRQFLPEHDSRTEDRHGYQFGRLGYDVNQPDQPVIRVSWEEADAFCRWLSQKTGMRIALPTEAQWEWACRAGSATPFWFGELDADYSPFANLGDRMLAEFAADTALDNYSDARPMVNPNRYDDWIPRDDRFNDRGFVTVSMGRYQPNPWGLQDMHGNAWEWTRPNSPADPFGGGRIVRGGSWYDRPQRCTASSRLSYPPWQRVFNVGFRVVLETNPAVALREP